MNHLQYARQRLIMEFLAHGYDLVWNDGPPYRLFRRLAVDCGEIWFIGRTCLLLLGLALSLSACERGSGYVGMLVCRGQPAMPLNISGDPSFLEDLSGVPMESATGTYACYLKLTGVYTPGRSP